MKLKEVRARKILDSRGEETIEVSVNGCRASSPSGKSKGKAESPQYRKSLNQSVKDVNGLKISEIEINYFSDLLFIEKAIKQRFGFRDVKQFGANVLVALEVALLKALAVEKKKELWEIINPRARKIPVPVGNAIGGGLHSGNKNKPIFQEFLLIPNEKSVKENVKLMNRVYNQLGKELKAGRKNDEGAWEVSLNDEEVLKELSKFKEVRIGLDIAGSSFFRKGIYDYAGERLSRKEQISYVNDLIKRYNLFYVEDGLEENDFSGFGKINGCLVVGDDLTATQVSRLKKAIKMGSINAMIVKPNQNGSLLEVAEIFRICFRAGIKTIISHRSGETMDDALADLGVGFGADFIKCGISTPWREVKLRRLVGIEKRIKKL